MKLLSRQAVIAGTRKSLGSGRDFEVLEVIYGARIAEPNFSANAGPAYGLSALRFNLVPSGSQ